MPATTTAEPYTDIRREQRVVHARYGRGFVKVVRWRDRQASVLFDGDGDVPRTVWLAHLTPEPADMPKGLAEPMLFVARPFAMPPPFRLCWPMDAVAGEGEAS